MKSRLAVFTLCEHTPVKELINDFNSNKDMTVLRETSSLMLIQYDRNRKNMREDAVDELLGKYILLQLTLHLY